MKKIVLSMFFIVSLALSAESSFQSLHSGNNRFVFGQVGPARADQYLLDTQTGRMWYLTVDSETGQKYLESIIFPSLDGKSQSLTPSTSAK